jgi:hypothetical protein
VPHPKSTLGGLIIILALLNPATAADTKRVNVQVGGDSLGDMCGAYGTLTEKVSQKTGTVPVYSQPNARSTIIDQLPKGIWVSMCDTRGAWEGIIYSKGDKIECGVGTPLENRQDYKGKCQSGWILRKHIGEFAG